MDVRKFIAAPGLFRAALAGAVVVNHSVPVYFGPAAVYVFFMLSGYWMYQMWEREYAPCHRPAATFILSRLWRLLPVYYVALAIFIVCDRLFPTDGSLTHLPAGWDGVHLVLSHLFILGYASQAFPNKLLLPVWSLDIELQFYLVAPLLILILQRMRPVWATQLALIAVAAIGLAAFFRFYSTVYDQSAGFLPIYLAFFLIGLLTAQAAWKPSAGLAVGSFAAALALVAICVALPATRSLFVGRFSGAFLGYNPHANVVLALMVAPYAMATLHRRPSATSLLGRSDRDLGNITYEIYLLHWPVLSVMEHFVGHVNSLRQLPALVAAWAALIPLSLCVYRFLDRKLERRRKAWVAGRRTVRADSGIFADGGLTRSLAG
jgi:peptidoglycan/LPS O-acetylase OafA/YrhL